MVGSEPYDIGREFKMGFYISFYDKPIVGGIALLETDDGQHVRVIAAEMRDGTYRLALAVNGRMTYLRKRLVPDVDREDHIDIVLDKRRNIVSLRMFNSETEQDIDLTRSHTVTVTFGYDGTEDTRLTAPFELRNIRFFKENVNTRHWDFKYYHNDSTVIDEIGHDIAAVTNPHWLIDDHINWRCIYTVNIGDWAEIEYSSRYDMFSIMDDDSIRTVNPLNGRSLTEFNSRGRILSPGLIGRYPVLDEMSLVRYSLDDDMLSVKRYDVLTGRTDVHHLQPPLVPASRYSVTAVDDRLYIFSQCDTVSGASHYRYALYEYDTVTWSGRTLWTDGSIVYDLCPSREMYYDSEGDCFFFASVCNGGNIVRISRIRPEWHIVSSAAFDYQDYNDPLINLYRGSESNRYHLVVNDRAGNGKHNIEIYSISAPFIRDIGDVTVIRHDKDLYYRVTWLIVALIVSLPVIILVRRRKYRCNESVPDDRSAEVGLIEEIPLTKELENEVHNEKESILYYDNSRSSISFLGGFSVRDKEGYDITVRFTARIKHLLVMLLLSEVKNDYDGITYSAIDRVIWGDKDEKSAQNNRNVTVRKLRLLLQNVGNIVITNDKGVYHVSLDGVFFDYSELMLLFERVDDFDKADRETTSAILELLSMGSLLPDTSFGWLNNLKSEFSEKVSEMLLSRLRLELGRDDNLAYRISETISVQTPLSEEALRAKCIILSRRNMSSLAASIYARFCDNYQAVNGKPYPHTLRECQMDF